MWTHSTGIVELWIWLSFECEWNDDDDVVVDTQQFHIIFKLHIITAGHCFLFFRSISQISICCLGCGWVRMEYTMHSICTVHTLAIVELRSVPLTFVSSAHLLLLLSCVGRETHSRKTHIETAHCTFLVRINVYLMNCRWRQRSSHKHLDIRNQHSHFCNQKVCVTFFFFLFRYIVRMTAMMMMMMMMYTFLPEWQASTFYYATNKMPFVYFCTTVALLWHVSSVAVSQLRLMCVSVSVCASFIFLHWFHSHKIRNKICSQIEDFVESRTFNCILYLCLTMKISEKLCRSKSDTHTQLCM